jgi:hypothetical protein
MSLPLRALLIQPRHSWNECSGCMAAGKPSMRDAASSSKRRCSVAVGAASAWAYVRIHVVGREGRRAATATAGALIVLRGTRGEGSRRARGQALSAGWGNRLGGADLSIQAVTA